MGGRQNKAKKYRCCFDANVICHHFKGTIDNFDVCKICVEYNKYEALLEFKVMLIRIREVLDEIKENLSSIKSILEEQQDYEVFGE